MRNQLLLAAALLATAPVVNAQTAAPSAAKKELVQKILQIQQPAIESMARQIVELPAARLMQQAGPALQQRIAADKREAVGKEIEAEVKKYVDESVPIARDRAVKLAPSTIGALLEERFTEEELKQVVALLESPVNKKFNAMSGEMQRALGEKLVSDIRTSIDPKMQSLQQSVAKRLGVNPAPAAAASSAKKK